MDSGEVSKSLDAQRYARHMVLSGVGAEGQEKIGRARVLVVGAGGLGSPILMYLAAAGVGTIGIVDDDRVELSNLQRQIAHGQADLGRLKSESARGAVIAINPGVHVETWPERIGPDNANDIVARYDVVVDALDSISCRLTLSDACVGAGKPMVHGAVAGWFGEAMTFVPGEGPCYRCLYGGASDGTEAFAGGRDHGGPSPLDPQRAGVLSSVPGVIGCIQATEVLKLIVGHGELLVGRLLLWDALRMSFDEVRVAEDPDCPCVGRRILNDNRG